MILGSMAALFLEIGLRLLEPWPLKFVLDHVIGQTVPVPLAPVQFQSATTNQVLLLSALSVVTLAGCRAVASYWSTIGFASVGNRALTALRAELFRHLQSLSLSFHQTSRSGDLVLRVIADVGMLQDVAVSALVPLVARLLILSGMVGVMFWMNATLALIAVSLAPLFWLRTLRLSRGIQDAAHRQRRREGKMAATVAESVGAMRVVQAMSLESVFSGSFSNQSDRSQKQDLKGKRLAASLERSVDVLIAASTALVLWQGAQLVLAGSLTPGDLVVFLAYLKTAYRPLQDFAKFTGRLGKASAAAGRVLEILNQTPAIQDRPGACVASQLQGHLKFEDVHFDYDPLQPLVSNLSLDIPAGSLVAIVGESGCGKSSLLSLVPRLYDPRRGRVLLDGTDLRDYTVESLRRQISIVLQDNSLFAGTIRENITLGLDDIDQQTVEAAARLANAHQFITSFPLGYDTVVGERGTTLSQGQRQRIAIARAAIRPGCILLLDEPTTGLDAANETEVVEALKRLARHRTTLWVTHNPAHAAFADLVVQLRAHLAEPAIKNGSTSMPSNLIDSSETSTLDCHANAC